MYSTSTRTSGSRTAPIPTPSISIRRRFLRGLPFTYDIHYGGPGNRNFTPGNSIFHCHLYPHFARGMWELWRTHDVFEDGSKARNLPDGEIADGTPNPAIVPLPHAALPPKPTVEFPGYPFYIAGHAGHRPPQPPLDMERDPDTGVLSDGGLPRHVVLGGTRETEKPAVDARYLDPNLPESDPQRVSLQIARRVAAQNDDERLFSFAAKLQEAHVQLVPDAGTTAEQIAMQFHAGQSAEPVRQTCSRQPGKAARFAGSPSDECLAP
jgi:hypothetical protein